MTREEAIARIKNHKIAHKMNEPRAIYISEALNMAIKALEQQPCEDTISRQAAIDATWFEPSYTDPLNVLTEVRDRLKALPSAQPDVPDTNVGDIISRQASIDAVETIGHIATMPDGDKCVRKSAVKYTLSMLPSAQPERKKGCAE